VPQDPKRWLVSSGPEAAAAAESQVTIMSNTQPRGSWPRIAFGCWLVAALLLASRPPEPPATRDGPDDFSLSNARRHLAWIAREPHPVGTPAHAAVSKRLEAEFQRLGVSVEIQERSFLRPGRENRYGIAHVRNVLAKLPGTATTGTVLLMAHYDSTLGTPGAADDGVGVAVLLETARVLKSEASIRNDVVFAATDGEELGTYGVRAFVADHPWSRNLGAVLNFEARGVSGPSMLFETGERDGWLIREFVKNARAPYASSLAPVLYRYIPAATDLNVFRGTGIPRLNFAFADGWQGHHSADDTPGRVDAGSIVHQGTYAVDMARRLATLDLHRERSASYRLVYFPLGRVVVNYDERLALPLSVAAALAWCWLLVVRLKAGTLRMRQIVLAVFALPVAIAAAAAAAWAVWWTVNVAATDRRALSDHAWISIVAFLAVAIAVMAAGHRLIRRWVTADGFALGVMAWASVLSLWTAVSVPGASYVFTWPLGCAVLLAWTWQDAPAAGAPRGWQLLLAAAASVVALLALVPTIRMLLLATPTREFVVIPFVAFALALLSPAIEAVVGRLSWAAVGAVACCGAALGGAWLVVANRTGVPEAPQTGIYVASVDRARATWLSADPVVPIGWSPPPARRDVRAIDEYVPIWYGEWLRRTGRHLFVAPMLPLVGPALSVDGDAIEGPTRTVSMTIRSARQAPEVGVCVRSTHGVLSASIDRHPISTEPNRVLPATSAAAPSGCDVVLTYYGMPSAGVPLALTIPSAATLDVEIADRTYAADTGGGAPPESSIGERLVRQSTLVTRLFRWAPTANVLP
jgi:hypothetical protein